MMRTTKQCSGPALVLQLALPALPGQPAAAIESGEILCASLHDGHAALVLSTAALALASSSLPSASDETPADTSTQKGAGGTDVTSFIDGGRLTHKDSLATHGYQRYIFKCTFQASCFEVQMSRFGHMEPVSFLVVRHLQSRVLRPRGYI